MAQITMKINYTEMDFEFQIKVSMIHAIRPSAHILAAVCIAFETCAPSVCRLFLKFR